ncbi:uncharacterized protein [Atheta coriaria]|uniref:uncharacterized protein n=1 Tax=Dalotia coriaria TaxID=877792 RepID=UPI0031F42C88
MHLTYFVPIPKIYINWLQLVQVFQLQIWIPLLLSIMAFIVYFWVEMLVTSSPIQSPIMTVYGTFLTQSLSFKQVPRRSSSRMVFALALIAVVKFSSLFATGIVTQMAVPRYEDGIRTEDEIEEHGYLKVSFADLYSHQDITDPIEREKVKDARYTKLMEQLTRGGAKAIHHWLMTESGLLVDIPRLLSRKPSKAPHK